MSRTVLITGGASGIGRATAERFRRDGDRVVVVDRRGGDIEADVRDYTRAHEIVAGLVRVDALVTCAGISLDGNLERLSERAWNEVVDTDLKGVFNYIAACAPRFRAQASGKVVAVASTLALRARRGVSAYAAAKAGVIGLVRAAARDLGEFNVNVNAVAPGLVRTPLTKDMPADVVERLQRETCLGRLGEPEDIAGVIHFLCSEDARHITGEVIRIDGGQLA